MNEEMRKEFEAIFPIPKNCIRCGNGYAVTSHSAWEADGYVQKWMIWQASREAMKPIKLPEETDTSTCKSIEKEILHDGINYGIQQCREAIKQAGYKVEE